jgi:uncharacterized protein (DUF2062 family)
MKNLRLKLKALWEKLIRQDASPNKIAGGFAIGLFATFYPVPVVDTLVALTVAWILRANKAACLIGNNFVLLIYPALPLLLATEIFVGRLLITAPALTPPRNTPIFTWLKSQSGPNLEALLVGGLVLGIPSALASFWLVRAAARRWQRR